MVGQVKFEADQSRLETQLRRMRGLKRLQSAYRRPSLLVSVPPIDQRNGATRRRSTPVHLAFVDEGGGVVNVADVDSTLGPGFYAGQAEAGAADC